MGHWYRPKILYISGKSFTYLHQNLRTNLKPLTTDVNKKHSQNAYHNAWLKGYIFADLCRTSAKPHRM